jgi:DNA repair and recombination protein RAD52
MSMHSSNHNEFPVPQNRQRPDNNHHQAHQFHRSSASLDTTFSPSAMSGPTPVFPTTPVVSSSSGAITTMMMMEQNATLQEYHPPGTIPAKPVQWVYNPTDGSVLLDHNGRPVSVDRLLATKPLRHELLTRPGPGNKRLTYISGEGISRTLNDIFGFDGWDLDITRVQREECLKDDKTGKYTVVYTAQVRLTHKLSGTYKEDCGAGDAVDRSFATAVSHALKASITDAMKRAARHFGDKCGNCELNTGCPFSIVWIRSCCDAMF